jgi:hypothetical protein
MEHHLNQFEGWTSLQGLKYNQNTKEWTFERDFELLFSVYLIVFLPKFFNFMIKKMCNLGEIKIVTLVESTIQQIILQYDIILT